VKRKCDKCDKPATHHSVDVKGKGENQIKVEKHLCDLHAAEEGLTIKPAHTPIKELLGHIAHAAGEQMVTSTPAACGNCGMTFRRFREKSLLGCPDCYNAFENALVPLLERAHEGASSHVGKVPLRAGGDQQRTLLVARLRKRLELAVEAEDYELAARLRDEIKRATASEAPA